MRLTETRRAVLEALVVYRHVATADLYQLLRAEDPSAERAVRGLVQRLASLGLVRRVPLVTERSFEGGVLHWQYLVSLTPKGYHVAQAQDLDPDNAGGPSAPSVRCAQHAYTVSSFHQILDQAAGERVWWRERNLQHSFPHPDGRSSVNPDAVFYWNGFYYFLEVEASKLSHYRDQENALMTKCRQYVRYADPQGRRYRERWPEMEGFFVALSMPTVARADFVRVELAEKLPYPLFRVIAEDEWRSAHSLLSTLSAASVPACGASLEASHITPASIG